LSSLLWIHYGHYKAASQDKFSTNLLSQKLTIIACSGVPPENWNGELQVMLEKIAGVCLVDKLRAIQLYKAGFNFYNQFFWTQSNEHNYEQWPSTWRAVQPKRQHIRGCQVWQTLTTDLYRQARQPMSIVSSDTANCYNWVNHVIMSLIWLTLLNGNIPQIV
jgi:hypothetical protein